MQAESGLDRRCLLLGLGAASLAPGMAAAQTRPVPVAAPPTTVTVTGEAPVVSLQTWLDTWGRPLARVRINGQGPFRFMVDTGSNTTVLSRATAARLGLALGQDALVQGVTGSSMAPLAQVQRLEIGNTITENLRTVVFDGPAFEQTDGILGMDMFANRRVRFSFRRREVEIEQSLSRLNLPISAPIRLRNGLLAEVDGNIGGVRAKFILDTGGELSVINPMLLQAITSGARRRRQTEPAIIMGATNHELEGVWVGLPTVDFMGVQSRNVTVASANAPIFAHWGLAQQPVMLVGMDVLSQLETLVIDYRRRRVHLRLLAERQIGDEAAQRLG